MKKRALCLILTLCMVMTLLPVGAAAADIVDSGTCGSDLMWSLDSSGIMTISGNGAMGDYLYLPTPPWSSIKGSVKSVVFTSGVERIGAGAFWGCGNITSVTIPVSVTEIGVLSFHNCHDIEDVYYSGSEDQWNEIDIDEIQNQELFNAVIHYNSESSSSNLGSGSSQKAVDVSFSLNFPELKQQYKVNQPEISNNAMEYGWYVEFTDGVNRFRVATAHWKQPNSSPATMSLYDMQTNLWFWDGNSFNLVNNCDLMITGTELTWKATIPAKYNLNADSVRVVLERVIISGKTVYTSSVHNAKFCLTEISPNYTSVSKDDAITLVFNKEVEFGSGHLTIRGMDEDGKTGHFDLNNRNGIATISGNTVTINLGEIILSDGWYDAEISPKAFKSKDGDYFLGMPGKGLWQFEVCSGLAQESVMQYAQKGHYFWKSDDTTKPAIPNGSDSEYASILMKWFDQYGVQSISKQELLSELSEPMYLPVTDVNGSTVLLNDKSTTVKQTLEDILFFESLKPFAVSIDSKLSTIEKWDQDGVLGYFSPLHQERKVYKEILGWYPQVDEYLNKRNGNSNLFYSSDAPLAYLFILTGAEDAGGMFFQYSKPFLKAQLDSSILQSSLNGLSQYKNYGDFKTAVTDGKASIKGLKAIYTAYSEGAPAGAKAIIKFGSDLLQTYFKDSNNSTLKDIGEAWSDYDTAMGAGELCAFLGGSIGAFPMVIELYDDLFTKVKDSVAAGYFIGDYYVAEKYPGLYDAIYDDETTFPEYSVYKMTESSYISTIEGDPILHNWCEYLSRITEGAMRDDCRQLRFDLVNYTMLLKYAQEFDVDAAKEALVKYISAECNQQKTTELYASCPVTVEVYSKENDKLVATLSSEDEDIFSCEYGSLYLMSEDNKTKCFVLNSSDYYASILPYADGTMDVAVVSTDENGLPVGKTFSDVALKAGSTLKLDLDDMDSGLQTQNGDIIEKESIVPVQRINISGKNEVAVGAKSTLSAEVLPEIASEKRLTWTSADTSIATVDNNGTISGVAFGETVITATSADGIMEDFTISVFVPSTELHVDKTQLRMVKGESFTLHASTTEGATHSVRWKSNNLNSVVVSADGVLTAKEAGDAIVTASIDGKEAEVLVVVSDESLDVMMYQTDLGGNALHLAMANPSCEKSLSGSAYVAVYESGRMIDLKEISIDLESNQEKTEMIALPDFSAEKTYSAVFYPLGDIAQDIQPEEIVFVNGSYELKDSTEAASSELAECQKVTVTYDDAQPGVGYRLYVLSDDSGVPTEENIVFLGHKIAEDENLTFTICPSEEYQDKECYVYVSDAESELHYLSSISGLGHKTELSGVKEATCTTDGYSGDEVCTVCGEIVKQGTVIKATGHKWDSGKATQQPTESREGIRTYACTVCGETRTETIPKQTPVSPKPDDTKPSDTKPSDSKPSDTKPADTKPSLQPINNPFTDVKTGDYFYDPVLWALTHEPQITDGMTENTFAPGETCTRGQVVTFLWRAMGCAEPTKTDNPFNDVASGDYFYKAVLWAVEKGITDGTSATTFSPNAPCTRAHVVTFLCRAEGNPKGGTNNPFADVAAGEYYTDAVLWAVSKGITDGTSDTTFSPADPCTRGQIVTFLYRDMK